jgi:hypothetical protein
MTDGQGWHDDPYEHDLARQGIKTKQPMITEEEAEQIVSQIKGQSPSHQSQSKASMKWFEEHWLKGEFLPENKLADMNVDDLQKIRKVCEENQTKAKNVGNDHHAYFYERQRDKLKELISDKLRNQMRDLEKQRNELSGW